MAVFIKSEQYVKGEGGQRKFTRSLIVTGVADTSAAINATMAELPATLTLDSFVAARVDITASTISESTGAATRTYEVVGTYDTENDSSESFVALNMDSSAAPIDMWRANASAPSSLNTPNDNDIGGTKVDQGGYPISFLVPQQTLTIVNIKTTNMADSIIASMGKRNSGSFAGGDAGYVLFAGASAIRKGASEYEITYKLTWDAFAHCRQQPVRDLDGKVKLTSGAGTSLPAAEKVLWRQPFPATSSFAFISLV